MIAVRACPSWQVSCLLAYHIYFCSSVTILTSTAAVHKMRLIDEKCHNDDDDDIDGDDDNNDDDDDECGDVSVPI